MKDCENYQKMWHRHTKMSRCSWENGTNRPARCRVTTTFNLQKTQHLWSTIKRDVPGTFLKKQLRHIEYFIFSRHSSKHLHVILTTTLCNRILYFLLFYRAENWRTERGIWRRDLNPGIWLQRPYSSVMCHTAFLYL